MQTPHGEPRAAPLWPLGALLAVFSVADVFAVPVTRDFGSESEGVFLIGLLVGLIAGQAGLVTLWAVFGSHPWALRWLTTLAAAEFLAGVLLVEVILSSGRLPSSREFLEEFLVVPLGLPLLFLAMQAPLWLFRAITGWQIVPRGREETSWGARQFGIVDLLAVTAFAAVALGLTQVAMSIGHVGREDMAAAWLPLAFSYAVAAAVNALLSLPCLWAVFAARDRPQAVGILVVWYILLGIAWLALLTLMAPGPLPAEAVGLTVVFEVIAVGVLAGGLCLIRAGPYVLLRPRRKRAARGIVAGADVGACPFAPVEREEQPPGESLKAESGELKAEG